ncbi:MAG TPA: hypothetical protein VM598_03550 [Bdellovibrionota bacterium]|nr:hypothetical protein [Bdellovibrionota bacterium]
MSFRSKCLVIGIVLGLAGFSVARLGSRSGKPVVRQRMAQVAPMETEPPLWTSPPGIRPGPRKRPRLRPKLTERQKLKTGKRMAARSPQRRPAVVPRPHAPGPSVGDLHGSGPAY